MFDDDFMAIQDAYNLIWTEEELDELIEQFAEWLADNFDDPTSPSMRGVKMSRSGNSIWNNDKVFDNQYNFITNKDLNSAEGIMELWDYFVKWQARERNEPNLINYLDKVQPYEFDPELGQWLVEPKLA